MLKPAAGPQGNGRSRCLLQSGTSRWEWQRPAPTPSDHASIARERPPTGAPQSGLFPAKTCSREKAVLPDHRLGLAGTIRQEEGEPRWGHKIGRAHV